MGQGISASLAATTVVVVVSSYNLVVTNGLVVEAD